jgi:hypothetical protein
VKKIAVESPPLGNQLCDVPIRWRLPLYFKQLYN